MKYILEYRGEAKGIDVLSDWAKEKEYFFKKRYSPYFKEREIWWTSIGFNIGDEQNGKNKYFERPVLIVKRFYRNLFLGLPLSSRIKRGNYYYRIKGEKVDGDVILSQGRVIDAKRLIRKIEMIDEDTFREIVNRYKDLV